MHSFAPAPARSACAAALGGDASDGRLHRDQGQRRTACLLLAEGKLRSKRVHVRSSGPYNNACRESVSGRIIPSSIDVALSLSASPRRSERICFVFVIHEKIVALFDGDLEALRNSRANRVGAEPERTPGTEVQRESARSICRG